MPDNQIYIMPQDNLMVAPKAPILIPAQNVPTKSVDMRSLITKQEPPMSSYPGQTFLSQGYPAAPYAQYLSEQRVARELAREQALKARQEAAKEAGAFMKFVSPSGWVEQISGKDLHPAAEVAIDVLTPGAIIGGVKALKSVPKLANVVKSAVRQGLNQVDDAALKFANLPQNVNQSVRSFANNSIDDAALQLTDASKNVNYAVGRQVVDDINLGNVVHPNGSTAVLEMPSAIQLDPIVLDKLLKGLTGTVGAGSTAAVTQQLVDRLRQMFAKKKKKETSPKDQKENPNTNNNNNNNKYAKWVRNAVLGSGTTAIAEYFLGKKHAKPNFSRDQNALMQATDTTSTTGNGLKIVGEDSTVNGVPFKQRFETVPDSTWWYDVDW